MYSSSFEIVSVIVSGNPDNSVKVFQTSLSILATAHAVFLPTFEKKKRRARQKKEKRQYKKK